MAKTKNAKKTKKMRLDRVASEQLLAAIELLNRALTSIEFFDHDDQLQKDITKFLKTNH